MDKAQGDCGYRGLGAVVFGSAQAISVLIFPLLTGARLWPVSFYRLVWGTSKGFVIGAAFALALAVVFRRYDVEELRAWKVGLWAAAAASLPTLAFLIDRAYHDLVLFPEPLSDLMNVLTGAILPGFLMGYLAVKLAQRSRPSG